MSERTHDVLVVGGGPAGAACAYWLAEAGHDVLLLEKKHYPREKTCGDGLTPRSVKQLHDIGLAAELAGHHRFDGLRSIAFGRTLELRWPEHPDFPSYGYVVTRKDQGDVVDVRARYVVVADGANSRFGRSLGTSRNRDYPLGMAIRGYFE